MFVIKNRRSILARHSRLGHVNFPAMILMSNDEMAYGLPKVIQPKEKCERYLMSKQARKPFPSKANFTV